MWSIDSRRAVDLLWLAPQTGDEVDLRATTRFEAIDELCSTLAEAYVLPDRAAWRQAVRARGVIGTGTDGGLAIPHAGLAPTEQSALVYGWSDEGIDWDAPDGRPIHLVVLLVSPPDDDGLQDRVLAALTRVPGHGGVAVLMRRARSDRPVWSTLERLLREEKLA